MCIRDRSQTVESPTGELVALRRFVEALTHARLVEEVFTAGLDALHEIFSPDRAFVVIQETRTGRQDKQISQEAGSSSTLTIPVLAGDQFVGKFVLCFESQRKFIDKEIELAEILALQAGVVIGALQAQRIKAEF